MAVDKFVKFRFDQYEKIKGVVKDANIIYFAEDEPLFYAINQWHGIYDMISSVDADTGKVTLTINPTKGTKIECTIEGAGMTTEQKAQLETAYKFAIDIGGTSADDIINKWQEVVDFLAGIEGGTLEGIVATKADKNTTIIAGDGLTGGGDLSENRTIKVESADDGITVNSDNIQLNTVDNLTTSSKTKPLSANQGKVLDGKVKSVADLLNDMFEKVTKNGKTYIKTKYGFASDEFVSAGGTDDTESGGGGGANLTQIWESLQTNNDTFKDRLINVAHIPTLTTGKISDFVSATQAIANTAVENKAEKATTLAGYGITDAVKRATKSANVSESCVGYTTADHNLQNGGLFTGLGADGLYGSQLLGNYVGTGLYYRGKINGTWTDWKEVAFKETTLSGYGITDAVTLNTDQTISGAKTFSNLKVSNTNLVTNLNANMVGGYISSVLFTCESGYGVDVNAPHRNKKSGPLLYRISSNCTNIPPLCTNGVLVHFNSQGTDTAFQLVSDYSNTVLYYRSGNLNESGTEYLYNRTWKQFAFTDKVLPLTGGTLTGALTVNAPINNTGALKLLGASEVSSTGMAVGSYARAVGRNSTALSSQSIAGLKSTDDSNVELYGYKSLPINVDGNVVYGFELLGGETKTFTYSGAEYSVTNPDPKQLGTIFLVPIDSSFIATSVSPYNRCAVVKANGVSRGRNPILNKVEKISDSVAILCVYNSATKVTSNDYSGEYTIYALRKTTDTQKSGSYALAIGNNSLAIGANSRSLQYYSVASGYQSLSAGMYSAAIGSKSIALGAASLAIGEDSIAAGLNSVAYGNNSLALGYYTVTRKNYQTVIGYLNEEDTSNIFVIGAGSTETTRKNVFTVDSYGYVRMGNRLHIGVGGKNEVYLHSDVEDQLYVHTSAGIPFLIQKDFIRRDSSAPKTTLGTDQYKWFNVFTESLKIADANLTYGIGTLTIDKALKTTSTLTATQGEFSNYIKIGNATISWNPKGYLEINEGLASHKFISAGGVVTGDAGGGGGGLSLTDMWVSLNGNIDAYGKSKIHIDHIPLDVILSHDDYENDVADRINTFNYSNSSSFTSAVKALIVADNIPTLEMSKIEGLETTLTNIGTVVQNNYDNLNESISTMQNGTIADHEARIKAIEKALTWQTV